MQSPDVYMKVVDLWKIYGNQTVLSGINFDVLKGKVNVIIGGSGAGKSVLMRQLIRLERPNRGQILVDNVDIATMNERDLLPYRRKFGMVFQMSALFDSMNVFDNVAFMLREHSRFSVSEIEDRVMDRLTILGIDHARHKLPSEISGGMQRRVAVARALAMEPELLIYDEPTTGLDPITSRTVDELIVDTQQRFGVTTIVITHDMASVFKIADRISYLYKGQLELTDVPDNFMTTDNQRVLDFIRSSGVDV